MPKHERPCAGYRCQALADKGGRWCAGCFRLIGEVTRGRLERCAAFLAEKPGDAEALMAQRAAVVDADRDITAERKRAA